MKNIKLDILNSEFFRDEVTMVTYSEWYFGNTQSAHLVRVCDNFFGGGGFFLAKCKKILSEINVLSAGNKGGFTLPKSSTSRKKLKSEIINNLKKTINGTFARNLHQQIAEDTYLKDAYMTKPD